MEYCKMNKEDIQELKKAADRQITELAAINTAIEKTQTRLVSAIDLAIKTSRYLAKELQKEINVNVSNTDI